jgi:nucleoside-diphosphate-sugar epimerase
MILVTGATGMLGSHLIWHLLQNNNRVVATCRDMNKIALVEKVFKFYTSNAEEYLHRIDWVVTDFKSSSALENILPRITSIYHCAAYVSLTDTDPKNYDFNSQSTKLLVEMSLRMNIQKFCLVSSIATCGTTNEDTSVDENTAWIDTSLVSLYARSKYESEKIVWEGIQKGLNALIVNPGVIIGASANSSGSAQLFELIKKGLIFYTNGGSGYVDVRDVVKIMVRLTTENHMNEKFIIVAENCKTKQILDSIADEMKLKRPYIRIGSYSMIIVAYLLGFVGKILDFKPKIDLRFAKTSTNIQKYNATKIKKLLNYEFISISQSIREVSVFLGKDQSKN